MKIRLANAAHGLHLPRLSHLPHLPHLPRFDVGGHGRAVENVVRTGQLVLMIWLAVYGGKLLAGAITRGAEELIRLLA